MEKSLNTKNDGDKLHTLRHDIKNQLSNINLALEQLRYEIPNPTSDAVFCMDTIAMSSAQINSLLKGSPE